MDKQGRRDFLRQVGAGIAAGGIVANTIRAEAANRAHEANRADEANRAVPAPASTPSVVDRSSVGTVRDLPKRRLGRIGLEVPPLSFGTAAMGHPLYEPEPFERVINAAIDAGVFYIDTARNYDVAEERLAPVLRRRRNELFLVTKTWAKSKDDCLRSLEKSLKTMQVDSVDLCHMHNVGEYETEQAIGKDGCLAGLREAKKRGLIKHIGCTGHLRPMRFIPVLETGEIDVLMCAMNFVDRHTYNFEEKVLPVARKHDTGIICMKVYGGVTGGWDGYKKLRPGRLVADKHRQDAFDYALSIPGVATCVVGIRSIEELRLAIEAVRDFKPLEGKRRERVLAKGAALAREWKDHFGPVA